mgnify:FL=1
MDNKIVAYAEFLIKFRWLVLLLSLAVTVAVG